MRHYAYLSAYIIPAYTFRDPPGRLTWIDQFTTFWASQSAPYATSAQATNPIHPVENATLAVAASYTRYSRVSLYFAGSASLPVWP